MQKRRLFASFVLALTAVLPLSSFAAYPDKPIRLIVPSAAGGAPDILMRTLATQLSQQMGVPFIIDNKPGASYVIGTMEIVRAAPDGYTLGYGNIVSLATNRALMSKLPYEVDKDLTLIGGALRVVNLLVVKDKLPIKNVSELIAYAKKNPGKLVQGTAGNGTSGHLGGELFRSMTQTTMVHVPYKAVTGAINDLIGGDIDIMLENTPVVGPHVKAGRMRALGISGSQRSAQYPDIPTISESGVPGFDVTAWGGIIGPANMSKELVNRLNAEIRTALASPVLRERFQTLDAEIAPSSPDEFRELSRRETIKWAEVVKISGAKLD